MADFKVIGASLAGFALALAGTDALAQNKPAPDKAKAAQSKKDTKASDKKGNAKSKKEGKTSLEKKKQEWASGSD